MNYAGFWNRAVALLIDLVMVALIGTVINWVFNEWLAVTITTFLGWGYFAGLESSERQATIGKSAMGLVVTDINGQRITFLRATVRYFAKILSGLLLGFGYFMAAFTSRKQALHDIIASTLVLKR